MKPFSTSSQVNCGTVDKSICAFRKRKAPGEKETLDLGVKIFIFGIMVLLLIGYVSAASSITFPGNKVKMSLVSQTPDPVKPGEIFDLKVRVQVLSSAARENFEIKNLKIGLIEEYPFSVVESESVIRDFGTLRTSEARDVTYRVRIAADASDGAQRLRFYYSSDAEDQVQPEGYLTINVRSLESSLAIASLRSEPDKIPAGSEATLHFSLQNAATSSMRDIAIRMDLSSTPFTPLETSTEKRLSQLAPGQQAEIVFKVITDTNAESKPYRVPVTLTYLDDQNNKFARNDSIGLLVYSEPELDYNIDEAKVYRKGDTGEVIISVSNIGPSKAKFITLEVLPAEAYTLVANDKVYLGNLDPDDFQTASFNIHVNQKNPVLRLKVLYKDAYNKDFEEVVDLPLKIYSNRAAAAFGLVDQEFGILQLLFLVLVLMFLYHAYKGLRAKLSLGASLMHGFKRTLIQMGRFVLWFRWSKLKTLPVRLRKMFREQG